MLNINAPLHTEGALVEKPKLSKLSPSGRETGGRRWRRRAGGVGGNTTTTIPNKTANNNIKRIDRRRGQSAQKSPRAAPAAFFPTFSTDRVHFFPTFCNFFSTQIRDGAVPAHFYARLVLLRWCVVGVEARWIYSIWVGFRLKNRKTSCVPFCRCNFRESWRVPLCVDRSEFCVFFFCFFGVIWAVFSGFFRVRRGCRFCYQFSISALRCVNKAGSSLMNFKQKLLSVFVLRKVCAERLRYRPDACRLFRWLSSLARACSDYQHFAWCAMTWTSLIRYKKFIHYILLQ